MSTATATKQNRRPQSNPKAAIQDWLTLVDPDGAFLTTTELTAVLPHGFEPMPPDQRTELRARAADLAEDTTDRTELRSWLLETVLDWDEQLAGGQAIPATAAVRAPEHGIQLRPDQVLIDVDDSTKVRLGVFIWPVGARLDRRVEVSVSGDTWLASPIQRAETWCRESNVPLALITDDDQWVLVWAPRGAPAASCRWRIGDLADERILQAGLVALLGARRFFAVADDETLEKLFERAANAEAEVTKGLGASVRRSVELLVAAISRDDVASGGRVLDGVPSTEVYESAVTVLMRLVFLLFAEERRLLPAEDPLWAESYSVLTLRDELRNASVRDGEDALERRSTAWHRLLATFRAVYGGVNHDRLTLPAYGGSLFNPERFPFLEGRRAPDHLIVGDIDLGPASDAATGPERPVVIDDRTVLAILDALLTIEVKSGRSKVAQRVSYKALDVEQIGHCYEGLLDHGCAPVEYLSVGLIGPEGNEPEFTITELETHLADGTPALCEWLSDKTRCNKKATALEKLLEAEPLGIDLARLRVACGHDDEVVARVLPFWGVIREDLRGLPVVLLPGSQFVTQTSTRRNMGAQYTTKALAEEVVQYALEPLVYEPGPQNEADPTKWKLRTPGEILDLRVCDPAVGSGAILTAAGRYLADRLVESVIEQGPGGGPFSDRLTELADASADEQTVLARREVVDHCLYGVDKNPVAAEMAKLSLWLTTMARERPFTFLDHAIQVGDSLLGITDMEQLRWLHLDPAERHGEANFETLALDLRLKEAADLARRLQELSVVTVRDATEKQRLHQELCSKLDDLSAVADVVVGAALSTAGRGGMSIEQRLDTQVDRIRTALDDDRPLDERTAALNTLQGISTGWLRTDLADEVPNPWDRRCLHWPLAFPEVFLSGDRVGFDAIVGNPPFLGNKYWKETLGPSFQGMVRLLLGSTPGKIDLAVVFLRQCFRLLAPETGCFGLITSTQSAEGQAVEVGLGVITESGTIMRARRGMAWPGDAKVRINLVWVRKGPFQGLQVLNHAVVSAIGASLTEFGGRDEPKALAKPDLWAFAGVDNSRGAGFLVDVDDPWLLRLRQENSRFVRPYISGEDLGARPLGDIERWVVDTGDSSLEEVRAADPSVYSFLTEVVLPTRTPELLSPYKGLADRWWQFWNHRASQFRRLREAESCIVLPKVAMYVLPTRAPTEWCFTNQVIVVEEGRSDCYGVARSMFFTEWIARYCTSFGAGGGIRPSVSKGVNTFVMPAYSGDVEQLADAWLEAAETWCRNSQQGLTALQNAIHHRSPSASLLADIQAQIDREVAKAYGWSDLDLNHDHRETPNGVRFTVSPQIKDELLDRLLQLNHERFAAEMAAGLHDKKAKKAPAKRPAKAANPSQEKLL
ncbi:MAG: hypothetical protein WBA45_08300 [Microthrixaceae bacterium]